MLLLKIAQTNKSSVIYILVLLILSISFTSLLAYNIYKYEREIHLFSPLQWVVTFVVLSIAMAFSLTPTTIAALLCGYFLGWVSLPGYTAAYILASYLGYQVALRIDGGALLATLSADEKVVGFIRAVKQKQFTLIVIARISPVLPFSIMNAVLAILRLDLKKYLGGSLVGMLPRTMVCIWIGMQFKQIKELVNGGDSAMWGRIMTVSLILISVLGFYWYFNKIVKDYSNKYLDNKPNRD